MKRLTTVVAVLLLAMTLSSPAEAGRIYLFSEGALVPPGTGVVKEVLDLNGDAVITCSMRQDASVNLIDQCVWHAAYLPDATDATWEVSVHWTSQDTSTSKLACFNVCLHAIRETSPHMPGTALCTGMVDLNENNLPGQPTVTKMSISFPTSADVIDDLVLSKCAGANCDDTLMRVSIRTDTTVGGCTGTPYNLADGADIKIRMLELNYP